MCFSIGYLPINVAVFFIRQRIRGFGGGIDLEIVVSRQVPSVAVFFNHQRGACEFGQSPVFLNRHKGQVTFHDFAKDKIAWMHLSIWNALEWLLYSGFHRKPHK